MPLTRHKSGITILTEDVANSWYGGLFGTIAGGTLNPSHPLVAGHIHDGQHLDGHAQKVHLNDHTIGQLNGNNIINASIGITKLNFIPGVFKTTANITSNSRGDLTADDFVFGSDSLDDDGNVNHNSRFLFDKSSSAFRAGSVISTAWDAANRASHSVAFGQDTIASGAHSSVLGGQDNSSNSAYSTIAGGQNNIISNSTLSFIGGGGGAASPNGNIINAVTSGQSNVIVGGLSNKININTALGATILGGNSNTIGDGTDNVIGSLIASGTSNSLAGTNSSVIAGGTQHNIGNADYCIIGSGSRNTILSSNFSAILAGGGALVAEGNTITSGSGSLIGAGSSNSIAADRSFIPAGDSNSVTSHDSMAGGRFSLAHSNSQIAWSSGRPVGILTTAPTQMGIYSLLTTTTSIALGELKTSDLFDFVIRESTTYSATGTITARQIGGVSGAVGDSKSWNVTLMFKRGAGGIGASTSILMGSTTVILGGDTSTAGWGITIGVNDLLETLVITASGGFNQNILWHFTMQTSECSNAA